MTSQSGGGSGIITLGQPQLVNLIAPRTDTVTFTSANLVAPSFTSGLVICRVTAISGTTPQIQLHVQSMDSQGLFSETNGGGTVPALTASGTTSLGFTLSVASVQNGFGPTFRIFAVISGTTPSVTWYCDFVYK